MSSAAIVLAVLLTAALIVWMILLIFAPAKVDKQYIEDMRRQAGHMYLRRMRAEARILRRLDAIEQRLKIIEGYDSNE